MAEHAILSPSSAKRWLNCTPSARLEAEQPDSSSVFADEGTLAHELGEVKILHALGKLTAEQYEGKVKDIEAHNLYNDEMVDNTDGYLDFVRGETAYTKDQAAPAIYVEQRVDFSEYVPEGFGKCDVTIVGDNVIKVIDYKHGKGVKVDAMDNPQLRLYALGAVLLYEDIYDFSSVEMTIYQPRLDHVDTCVVSVEDLKDWAEKVVKPTAAIAWEGAGECNPGDWCKFCKVKHSCRAIAEYSMEVAKTEFRDPKTLGKLELLQYLERFDIARGWFDAVESHLLGQALNGEDLPGYKVVEGQSRRKFTDQDAVISTLKRKKYRQAEYLETKLKSLGAIEKLVGKGKIMDVLGEFIDRPKGKPKLVPESAPGKPYQADTAADDFKDL